MNPQMSQSWKIECALLISTLVMNSFAQDKPSPRTAHMMAYDESRKVLVTFGSMSPQLLADTWEFDGKGWRQFEVVGPSGRTWHAMAYDPNFKDVVLFGGKDLQQNQFGDTWAWDGKAWKQMSPTTSPQPRFFHLMSYKESKRMPKILFSFICAFVLVALTNSTYAQTHVGKLSTDDAAKIKAVNEAYVAAWLKNDSAAVMKTLAPDAVLIPQGARAIEGMKAIKQFWWPSGGITTVKAFTTTTEEVGGNDDAAYVRGTFKLSFTYEDGSNKLERNNNGNYLMIMKRQADGTWRISHRMWGDLPPGR